jgi:hypothetical protein
VSAFRQSPPRHQGHSAGFARSPMRKWDCGMRNGDREAEELWFCLVILVSLVVEYCRAETRRRGGGFGFSGSDWVVVPR